ncbi:MAG: mannose-1-phosphate guanylyltransferase/mannose-6-phosphate isomerase [Candidatus Omnitrophota bacterium]
MKKSVNKHLYALILAGGVGSRFWPFSRELEPKQFLNITGQGSLIQNTIRRLDKVVAPSNIYIISRNTYFYELKKQIKKFNIPESNILLEPQAKNTAPAIGLGSKFIAKLDKDAIVIVLPSDHYVPDYDNFRACIFKAAQIACLNFLVTIGIRPKRQSSGYGYIKVDRTKLFKLENRNIFYKVEKFFEKPSLEKIKKHFKGTDYFWNSGIFVWKASEFMDELKAYLPDLYKKIMSIRNNNDLVRVWKRVTPISVDYGILEHSKKIALIAANFSWADLGSWDALNEVLAKDVNGNVFQADSLDLGSKETCVFSRGNRLIATIGLEGLVIADTPDALLVCDRHKSQEVRKLIDDLKSLRRKEHIRHLCEKRPWGSYTVLQVGEGFKIKLVEIDPKKRLSLQSHSKRAEHWVVVHGCAKVTYSNKTKTVKSNQSIYIPKGTKHRLENITNLPLKIVEVQTGNYLEEDDIKRFEDDFDRLL